MSPASSLDLANLQRWFCAAVRQPGAHTHAGVEGVIAPSARQTPAQRLGVYQRGHVLRLLESMRAKYPALRHALGTDLFDGFACDYLKAHPPRSYTLLALDQHFAQHLSTTRPELAPDSAEPWPDFIVDLARLERLVMQIFEGPGLEREPAWERTVLPERPDDRCTDMVIEPAPTLRLLRSTYPVGRYLLAVYRGQHPPLPLPEPTYLALGRRNYEVQLHEMTEPAWRVLKSLIDGTTLGTAVRPVARPIDGEVWAWLREWGETGLFAGVSTLDTGRQRPDPMEVR